jgi:hypothetical protein
MVYINPMPLPVIQRVLHQLDRISILSPLNTFKLHRYEPLSMASSAPTDRGSEASNGKAVMDFSEDVEASRASSQHDENAHIQRVELTEEDVCPPLPSHGHAISRDGTSLLTFTPM